MARNVRHVEKGYRSGDLEVLLVNTTEWGSSVLCYCHRCESLGVRPTSLLWNASNVGKPVQSCGCIKLSLFKGKRVPKRKVAQELGETLSAVKNYAHRVGSLEGIEEWAKQRKERREKESVGSVVNGRRLSKKNAKRGGNNRRLHLWICTTCGREQHGSLAYVSHYGCQTCENRIKVKKSRGSRT